MSQRALGQQFEQNQSKRHVFSPYAPLFHGSEHDFSPGDIITPQSVGVAHATTGLHTARAFGSKVYEVEPVDQSSVWDRQMRHTGDETHYERLSESGYRIKSLVPKSRPASYYQKKAVKAHERWVKETGAAYCQSCAQVHEPEQHR